MTPELQGLADRSLERWQRIRLGVRLAYNPGKPCVIACYIGVGRKMAQNGFVPEVEAEQRMFRLLLQAATDLALPWAWRHHCLSHAVHPLARLTTLLAGDDFAVTRLHALWELAQQQLPTTPGAATDEG